MTEQLITFWILGIGGLIGGSTVIWSLKKGSRSKWSVVGVGIMLVCVTMVSLRQDKILIEEQTTIIHQELSERFFLTGTHITAEKETDVPGNTYRIVSENGEYTAHFHPRESKGFKLDEVRGESLRGRRNAYETFSGLPDLALSEGVVLEYQNPELYTLNSEDGDWEIHLHNHQVDKITDEEGEVKFQSLTNEGEMTND